MIDWSAAGKIVFVGFCVSILGWTVHDSVKQQEAEEARRTAYIFSNDRDHCRVYTELEDFEYHPGLRRAVTLTMKNGDKFLYYCGERLIDICNHLNIGNRVCYEDYYPNEVVQGWNEHLK